MYHAKMHDTVSNGFGMHFEGIDYDDSDMVVFIDRCRMRAGGMYFSSPTIFN